MICRLLIGDVFDRMAELPDHSVDLILTSPPFLALRSYLPEGHPDKAKEIGSEATPAEYLDVLLKLTAEWRRLLAPHGSLVVELGDTYAGSGGAGGDYDNEGMRDGQPRFTGSARQRRLHPDQKLHSNLGQSAVEPRYNRSDNGGAGWPLDKSLVGIPTLYTWSLAYGRNLLTGAPSPAGRWRIRNLKPWIRSNPPVGALGDKERPATSYITVACVSRDRWFDLDAVRTSSAYADWDYVYGEGAKSGPGRSAERPHSLQRNTGSHPAGAPPLDHWHQTDHIIDTEIDRMAAQRPNGPQGGQIANPKALGAPDDVRAMPEMGLNRGTGARGVHIRRALEKAGILPQHPDALDISPRGYSGAHYAVWPPELCRQLIDEMCPRRVCVVCGQPSRRVTQATPIATRRMGKADATETRGTGGDNNPNRTRIHDYDRDTVGWSDCGCPEIVAPGSSRPEAVCSTGSQGNTPGATSSKWRPGLILDPFAGSGTTLAVASGMGRDSIGIDIDPRSADLARERVGMFLDIDCGTREATA